MPKALVLEDRSVQTDRVLLSRLVVLVAVVALLSSFLAVFVGFHHSLFDFHGFRQTQTAISAEYMQHGGAFFAYQTPVAGPPWTIPFEFPIYQKIVAVISEHLRFPLIETGRAVSIACFFLCFLPLASILKRLHYTPVQILAVLSLFAVSPLYIFVSRMFMIESTVLFLALMYTEQVFRLTMSDTPWRFRCMISAAVFGALAGMVKVTTFAPYLLLACGLIVWSGWKSYKQRELKASSATAVTLLCVVFPILCTSLWTRFADAQKAKTAFGYLLVSKAPNQIQWNFGTLAQRMDPASYATLIHRIPNQAGSLPLLILLVLIYAAVVRKWDVAALLSLALYLVTPAIFFNVHFVHEYYPYANTIGLVVAAGLLIADLINLPGRRAWLGFALFVVFVATFLFRYYNGFYRLQRWNAPGRPEAAAIIDRTTNPNDVIVISGLGLSSELPYQSHRRAIMDFGGLKPVAASIQMQHADTIPEFVACDDARGTDYARAFLNTLNIQQSAALHADNCDIYLRSTK